MATEKQINANRSNGKKGGPKTPAGRAAVRHNALKHGLSAQHPVIPDLEKQSDFDQYLNQLHNELQPVGIMEQMLVHQIADAYWRRQRIVNMETGMFDINNDKLKSYFEKTFESLTAGDTLHTIAEFDARQVDMLGRYYRYDARFERSFFKAWNELKSLQSARQSEPEAVETEAPKHQPNEFAKQTERVPEQPVPSSNCSPHPLEKPKNDPFTM